MFDQSVSPHSTDAVAATGKFLTLRGERWYAIREVDRMDPFFISVVSNLDHWLFASSTGGLTAGRVSPESALFPYVPVDRIHESIAHTGPLTILRPAHGKEPAWEPYSETLDGYRIRRNLYKNSLGNKLCFEEVNEDLGLAFRYTWMTSDRYGFVRECVLENRGKRPLVVDLLDGLQNILPAGTPLVSQSNASNLVDAYKWTELDEATGLALYTLYSGISDRAEPSESLLANSVFCLGLEDPEILLSSTQLKAWRSGRPVQRETHTRGIRGAYVVQSTIELAAGAEHQWQLVADVDRTQAQAVELRRELRDPAGVAAQIADSIDRGSDELARIMATADGFQVSAEENVTTHHYANVLFNVLRGGIFDDQYAVWAGDFQRYVRHFNRSVYAENCALLDALPEKLDFNVLLAEIRKHGDPQLERLCYEYLPITFGRRHGDPSRPWNRFAIRLTDEFGNRLLSYQGNWRDIFQNWEALTFSYPEFVESVIAKFVNASTVDGYNPYRITKEGIDWETEEPDDPWSYIGYWGDHQIIYLQKLLELSHQFHPGRLRELLRSEIFSYANVPYRIRPFEAVLANPKSTVDYDHELAERIEERVAATGADGKLVLDNDGKVYQVSLFEKLLVPLLAKLSNLVLDGGIWLNTQRPEWNDANNALVGHGLSMVTLYYMRRYVRFLQELLGDESAPLGVSEEVAEWLGATTAALERAKGSLGAGPVNAGMRYMALLELGEAAAHYRARVYESEGFSAKVTRMPEDTLVLLDAALAAIDHSITTNRRDDNLYHAYNVLQREGDCVEVGSLYPMLEGQVAVLSSGAIAPEEACAVLEALFDSAIYRADQDTFMLYPDRELPGFFEKNVVPAERVTAIPLLAAMLSKKDARVVVRDADGCYRFNADFRNAGDLADRLDALESGYGDMIAESRDAVLDLYESVFNHRAFTGRSGGMFGFEGLGCIYWHMVAKLLLAVQENFFAAADAGADESVRRRLGSLYYRVRKGIGFNKSPAEYGAFPTDPYSHTPKHAGAQQPGMTGQVKEEVLTRFGELGLRVRNGRVSIEPGLLRAREFRTEPGAFRYLDVDGEWRELAIAANSLAFTWCQVPIVYGLGANVEPGLSLTFRDGSVRTFDTLSIAPDLCAQIFKRNGNVRKIEVTLDRNSLHMV